MLKEGPGKYAGNKYNKAKVEAELNKLPDNMTPDQAYDYLIGLLAEDYKSIVNRIENINTNYSDPSAGPQGNIKSPSGSNRQKD